MRKSHSIIFLTVIFFSGILSLFARSDKEIMQAMRDELQRSMDNLSIESLEKPYYIEYKLHIREINNIRAVLGAVQESNYMELANLDVTVRVVDYEFDNTNFFDVGLSFFGSSDDEEKFRNRNVPIELDYSTLRRELWLATDAAYKQASELLAKKEATIKNRARRDTTHDFLKLEPVKRIDTVSFREFPREEFEDVIKKLSGVFRDYPEINNSTAGMEYIPEITYYVNSEGREYIKTDFFTGLEVLGYTQAEDGMPLVNFYTAYGNTPDQLPKPDSLMNGVRNIADKLIKLRESEYLMDAYSGPIMFEGQAAAELFAQVFAPKLVAQRSPLTEQGMQDEGQHAAFQTKVGGRVLPEFLSVDAIPSKEKYNGVLLTGQMDFDDEGVESEDLDLVKDGYLKTLFSSRVPTKRIRNTNGHMRNGAPMFSTLLMTSNKEHTKTDDQLKKRMMELCNARELPFGLIVRKAVNQNIMFTTLFRLTYGNYPVPRGNGKMSLIEVYKIYPDGREELIRGTETNGLTVQSFKDILQAGEDKYVMNYLAPAVVSPFYTGGSQYMKATVITPDLLFEDGEIRPMQADFPKPPILENPISSN